MSGRLLVFASDTDDSHRCEAPLPFYDYDLETDTWRQAGVHRLMDNWCTMFTAAVPLHDHGVVFLANFRSPGKCSVLLYKHGRDG